MTDKKNYTHGVDPVVYFDVTSTIRTGLNTGVQRVVRALLKELDTVSQAMGLHCEPIMYHFDGFYRLKDAEMILTPNQTRDFTEISFQYRDVYLCADAFWTQGMVDWYQYLRERGVTIATVIYDLIPITHPQFVDRNTATEFETALETVVERSDVLLSISRTTLLALKKWHFERNFTKPLPLCRVIPLAPALENVPANAADSMANRLPSTPYFLQVGTIEPRRGYEPLLRDFITFWDAGGTDALVIVGKYGDQSETIKAQLINLKEAGCPIHWFDDMGDAELHSAYSAARAVICASQVEGYGLPVAEGLLFNGRVFANRLPVFGEFAGALPYYFNTARPGDLTRLLFEAPNLERVTNLPNQNSWTQTAKEIANHLSDVSPSHGKTRLIEQNTMTNDAVRWAYWLVFGRIAEPKTIENWSRFETVGHFWSAFLHEFINPDIPLTRDLVRLAFALKMGNSALSDEDVSFFLQRNSTLGDLTAELSFSIAQPDTALTRDLVRLAYFFIANRTNISDEEADFWIGHCKTMSVLREQFQFELSKADNQP